MNRALRQVLQENHEAYGMESAMAKMYASDIAQEVVYDALQIFGGSGFLESSRMSPSTRMPITMISAQLPQCISRR